VTPVVRGKKVALAGLIIFVAVALPLIAWAITAPGLSFSIEYRPELASFPEKMKETDPELYQAHLSLVDFPKRLADLESARDQQVAKHMADKTLDAVTRRDKVDEAKREYQTKVQEIAAQQAELRNAFIVLATERLKRQTDPDILLFLAQQYYAVRGQPPEVTQKELKSVQEGDEAQAAAAGEAAVAGGETAAPGGEAAAPPPPPAPTGTPSLIVNQKFNTNYERIVAACEEIRERFPNFSNMDRVIRLMAVCKMETGMAEDAVYLWKELLKKHPQSPYVGDAYFRLAEYEFETPTSYDHFTQAAEYYAKALQSYTEPTRDRFRILYKRAWAKYLSPDLNEEAKNAFVQLYREIQKVPEPTEEMLSMKAEVLEAVKQIVAQDRSVQDNMMFGP